MLVLGMLGKVGAVFATIPDPLIGAILLVMVGERRLFLRFLIKSIMTRTRFYESAQQR